MGKKTETKYDNVNYPKHYDNCSLECIDIMLIAFGAQKVYDYCVINAYKYLHRYKYKNGLEDLRKAQWYIEYACTLLDMIDIVAFNNFDELQDMVESAIGDLEDEYGEE